MSTLGGIHLVTCTLVYLLVGYGAKTLLATRPQMAQKVSIASGMIMVAIAALLFYEQLK